MSEPFLSEIKVVSFNFPPKGWALCNGQTLPINQNQALFALLGTTYGGNGQTTFNLPDLRGRVPIHAGSGFTLGQKAGQEAHTITMQELPTHTHSFVATKDVATTNTPTTGTPWMLAQSTAANLYASAASNTVAMAPNAIGNVGGSQPHNNMAPYLVLNFIIALQGIFPSQN